MDASYYVGFAVLGATVAIALILRQRGRQSADVSFAALGAKAWVKTGVDPEMDGIKAGRDIKIRAGVADPARVRNAEAGRDFERDTTGQDPKA